MAKRKSTDFTRIAHIRVYNFFFQFRDSSSHVYTRTQRTRLQPDPEKYNIENCRYLLHTKDRIWCIQSDFFKYSYWRINSRFVFVMFLFVPSRFQNYLNISKLRARAHTHTLIKRIRTGNVLFSNDNVCFFFRTRVIIGKKSVCRNSNPPSGETFFANNLWQENDNV